MAKVFISYSRKDIDFAKKLTGELQKNDLDFWVDWEGIPPTVDWWKQIEKGIEEADVFLFLISPDSAASKICAQEIECAIKNGKRLIPLMVREIKGDAAPKQIGQINWIFFRENDDFDEALAKLLTGIQTDYEWAATQRRLQVKALEWERNNQEGSFLLRGKDLHDAESQLAANTSKEPHPTDLQREYVHQSRQAADLQRRITTGISFAALIALAALAVFGFYQANVATNKAKLARVGELAAESAALRSSNFQVAMLLGIEAYQDIANVQSLGTLMDNAQAQPQLHTFLNRHAQSVSSLNFSPDGELIASGSFDNTVILWSKASRQALGQPLTGHQGRVTSVAFSPNGKILASGSYDKTIILWDVTSRQPISQPLTGHTDYVMSVAFSPDGKVLASGGADNQVILWEVSTVSETGTVTRLDVSITNDKPLNHPPAGHINGINSLAFSPDGKILAYGTCAKLKENDSAYHCVEGDLHLWDTLKHQPIGQPLRGHSTIVKSIAFSPDGKTLASSSEDQTILLWDVSTALNTGVATVGSATSAVTGYPLTRHTDVVSSVSFSPDGKTLVSASWDNTIILWDLASRQPIGWPFTGHVDGINSVSFSPDGKTLASASGDHTIILWDAAMILSQDGFAGNSIAQPLTGHTDWATSVAFSPDGKTIAAGSFDRTILIWDLASRQPIGQPLKGHTDAIGSVAFSPDGKTLASASWDKTILLWDLASHQPIGQPLKGHTGIVNSVAFSPDGKMLASASWDHTIMLWDVARQQPVGQPLAGHTEVANSVAFSPDGKILASGSFDQTILLWDVETRKPIGQPLIGGANSRVLAVNFSPDGKTLASGNQDFNINLWDVATGKPIGLPFSEHSNQVYSVAFSPDGKTLASGSFDHHIILWDMARRQSIGQPLMGHADWVTGVAFSPDGKTLASSSFDKKIILWDLDPQSWVKKICQRVNRNLTQAEWEKYFPDDQYHPTCAQWLPELEATAP